MCKNRRWWSHADLEIPLRSTWRGCRLNRSTEPELFHLCFGDVSHRIILSWEQQKKDFSAPNSQFKKPFSGFPLGNFPYSGGLSGQLKPAAFTSIGWIWSRLFRNNHKDGWAQRSCFNEGEENVFIRSVPRMLNKESGNPSDSRFPVWNEQLPLIHFGLFWSNRADGNLYFKILR